MSISSHLIDKVNVLLQRAEGLRQRDTRAKAQSILDRMEADNITISDLREVAGTQRPKQDARKSEPAEAALHVGRPARIGGESVHAVANIPLKDKHSPRVAHAALAAKQAGEVGREGGRRSVRANSVAYWRFISN